MDISNYLFRPISQEYSVMKIQIKKPDENINILDTKHIQVVEEEVLPGVIRLGLRKALMKAKNDSSQTHGDGHNNK